MKRASNKMPSDPFKSLATLVEAKDTARLADAAAKMIAQHCDKRIEKARDRIRAMIDDMEASRRGWQAEGMKSEASHLKHYIDRMKLLQKHI